jgi:hypothetical protein
MKAIRFNYEELEILINLLADEKDNFALTTREHELATNMYYRLREIYLS